MTKEINGTGLGFYETGAGEKCLFLHGNRDCKNTFYRMIPYLKDRYHLHFLDYRGHGESQTGSEGYTYEQFVSDIDMLLAEEKIEKINLIGHSIGGVLSILYYLKHPEKVNKLVLLGTSSHFEPKFKRPEIGAVITQEHIRDTNLSAKPFFFLPDYKEVEEEVLNNWSKLSPLTHEKMIEMGHVDLRGCLKEVKCRVLLILGEEDKICVRKEGEYMKDNLPHAALEFIPKAGHYMFMERPELTAEKIRDFLDGEASENE